MRAPRQIRRADGSIVRCVGAALSFVAVAVGAPSLLVAAATARFGSANPLAGVDPPWRWFDDGATNAATEPIADSAVLDALVRVSLCVGWIAVATIVATTVSEVVHLVRHDGLHRPDIRGLGWAQRVGRLIAAGLIVVLPLSSPSASIAQSLRGTDAPGPASRSLVAHRAEPAVGTVTGADVDVPPPTAPNSAEPATPSEHVVQRGESVYAIAERLAARHGVSVLEVADAILDANLGRSMGPGERFTNPAYVEVGWVLEIPARYAADVAIERDVTRAAATHVVVRGDTLWDIAEQHFGDPSRWREIWERNAGRDMGGGRTFDDPRLILPGWELHLGDGPAPGPADEQTDRLPGPGPDVDEGANGASASSDSDVRAEQADRVDGLPVAEAPDDAPPGDELPDDRRDWPIVVGDPHPADPAIRFDDMAVVPPTTPPAVPPTTPPASDVPSTSVEPVGGGGSAGGDEHGAPEAPDVPSPIRLEHAALLAAGVLALVGVRRRQRLRTARPRHRVPTPPPEVVETERQLRAVDGGERALRVDVATRAIACALRETTARIGWVEVSVDGDLDVQLTEPAALPAPWSGSGQQWRLAADVPIELLAEAARQVDMPCMTLVQIGVSAAGGEVLVDVEACGLLAIEATPRHGDEVVRAIASGLASSLYAEVAHLIAVSLDDAALLGHRNAHVVESTDAALDLAAGLVGTTFANERSTFVLRSLRTGGEAWEPAVVLLCHDDAADTDDVDRLCPVGGHGLAVVATGDAGFAPEAAVRIVAEGGRWRLAGFGDSVELTPLGLSPQDVCAVAAVLDDASRPLESLELAAADDVRWADDVVQIEVDATDDRARVPYEPRPYEVVVGLLGGVTVSSREGVPGSFERSKTVELIAWLATHRDRSTRSNARAALWELDVRDATFANVVSEARRALARLVPPPDGEEWVARTLTDQLPLHELVVTDAQLVEHRLEHSRLQPPSAAMDTLRPAVAMIRDLPFAGTSYLWPDAEGIASNLVLLAMTAATEFAGHALSLGDTDGVFWATGQALKVLPGHEELIALRMRAHARAGDLAGVRQEWESYERVLHAESWSDGEPAPKLVALRHELLSS